MQWCPHVFMNSVAHTDFLRGTCLFLWNPVGIKWETDQCIEIFPIFNALNFFWYWWTNLECGKGYPMDRITPSGANNSGFYASLKVSDRETGRLYRCTDMASPLQDRLARAHKNESFAEELCEGLDHIKIAGLFCIVQFFLDEWIAKAHIHRLSWRAFPP